MPYLQDEIKSFETLEIDSFNIVTKLEYYHAKACLANSSIDYQTSLETNLRIQEILESEHNIPKRFKKLIFPSKVNAFNACMSLDNKELAYKLLTEAENFLQNTDTLLPVTIKEFSSFLLYNNFGYYLRFENNIDGLKSAILKMEKAVEDDLVHIPPHLVHGLRDFYLCAIFLVSDYEKFHKIAYERIHKKELSSHSVICFLSVQYFLFDLEFIENSFRNIKRTIIENSNYTETEIDAIKSIIANLKKLKLSGNKDLNLVSNIEKSILAIEDDYSLVHQRIASSFINRINV